MADTAPFHGNYAHSYFGALKEEIIREILSVCRSMSRSMERSPSTFAKMSEEEIRDFFLVALNGQFEGAAAGETFNFQGKTDILIRERDRNLFIAECKIWAEQSSSW